MEPYLKFFGGQCPAWFRKCRGCLSHNHMIEIASTTQPMRPWSQNFKGECDSHTLFLGSPNHTIVVPLYCRPPAGLPELADQWRISLCLHRQAFFRPQHASIKGTAFTPTYTTEKFHLNKHALWCWHSA